MYDLIEPGKTWLDTEGKRIQAHGGSVIWHNGEYYWYGENKEKTDGVNGIWHFGVRCYTSTDLYNWKDIGIIIPPNIDDPNSTLNPKSCMDRPHIIYNVKSKKFVCWVKIMEKDGTQDATVLISDRLIGPYVIVREHFRPFNMNFGDFDIFADEANNGFIVFARAHDCVISAQLDSTFTDVIEPYTVQFSQPHPPYAREAPVHFFRKGEHYLITSGTTGYYPNPSEVSISLDAIGPYTVLGNPHFDKKETSYYSQISCVFKVRGKDNLYIACADRWLPKAMYVEYKDAKKIFDLAYSGHLDEAVKLRDSLNLPPENTSIADYVWLPIIWDNNKPKILWSKEWRVEDFE